MRSIEIKINNVDDYNKFIKKIKRYKVIFYKNKKFINSSNKIFKDIPFIIEALNIKNKKKRIDYVYDYCCKYIDEYCTNKNYCEFKNNKCLTQYNNNYFNGCCRGCRYQSNNGCTTSNITFKLFYCNKVKEKHKVVTKDDLKILNCLPFRNRVIVSHDFFVSREEMLKDLHLNSLLIFSFKTLLRFRYIRKITKSNQ